MKRLRSLKESGSILLSFVITLPFIIIIAASYVSLATASFRSARQDQLHTHAQLSADAGADYAVDQISQNSDWSGTSAQIELLNSDNVRTTYDISVSTNGSTSKTITSVGRAFWPANSTTPAASVSINIGLRPVTSGDYSVVSGVGGLIMSNSAKILGGDVLVNGTVSLSNSAQIGLKMSPVDLEVAHQSCPTGGGDSYPRLCASGENGQPISLVNSSHIYGSVKANNQTDGDGMSNPGLVASSGVTPQTLPNHDRAVQKAAIADTITGSEASCSGSQTRTWAANTKITGNVVVSNSCRVSVQGDVWITGNLSISNSGRMSVADSLGATRPNIMIDGPSGANFSNSTVLASNNVNTGFQVITYWSSDDCSPDRSNVTGEDLYNSRNISTIRLDNSASGPQTIFYARWSRVNIVNSGQIGALVGQSVKLANSGTITFGTSVSTSTTFWVIDSYRRIY